MNIKGGLQHQSIQNKYKPVKLNQIINELDFFEEIYIHPAMGDSGLALSAAILKANELGEITKPLKLDNAFLGQSFSKENWLSEFEKYDINQQAKDFYYTGMHYNDFEKVHLDIVKGYLNKIDEVKSLISGEDKSKVKNEEVKTPDQVLNDLIKNTFVRNIDDPNYQITLIIPNNPTFDLPSE